MSTREDRWEPSTQPEAEVAELLTQVGARRITRREVLRRGIALGLTVPAIGWLLAACGGDDDNDEASAPTSVSDDRTA